MKTISYYIAFDGTKFNSSLDCRNYEVSTLSKEISPKENIKMFDQYFNQLDIFDEDEYEECFYIWVENVEAIEDLWKIHHEAFDRRHLIPDFNEEAGPGLWVFDNGNWINVENVVTKCKRFLQSQK